MQKDIVLMYGYRVNCVCVYLRSQKAPQRIGILCTDLQTVGALRLEQSITSFGPTPLIFMNDVCIPNTLRM